jgi:hypothetical protein
MFLSGRNQDGDVHLKGLQVEVVQRGQIQVEATGIEEVWVVGSNMGKIVVRKNLCSRDMQKAVDIGECRSLGSPYPSNHSQSS